MSLYIDIWDCCRHGPVYIFTSSLDTTRTICSVVQKERRSKSATSQPNIERSFPGIIDCRSSIHKTIPALHRILLLEQYNLAGQKRTCYWTQRHHLQSDRGPTKSTWTYTDGTARALHAVQTQGATSGPCLQRMRLSSLTQPNLSDLVIDRQRDISGSIWVMDLVYCFVHGLSAWLLLDKVSRAMPMPYVLSGESDGEWISGVSHCWSLVLNRKWDVELA